MEPEFPDPFLCQSLCREARTSPWLNAHTPAASGKEGGGGEVGKRGKEKARVWQITAYVKSPSRETIKSEGK